MTKLTYQACFFCSGVEAKLLDLAIPGCDKDNVDREVILMLRLHRLHHEVREASQGFLKKNKSKSRYSETWL